MDIILSNRRSGKSTRLVNNIINYLDNNPNNSALIIAPNSDMRKYITKMVVSINPEYINRVITSHKMLNLMNNTTLKQFVDEFTFLSDNCLVIDHNAYYTGSIKENMSEMAKKIVDMSKKTPPLTPAHYIKSHKF